MDSVRENVVQTFSACFSFEIVFALFLFAGSYKQLPWLAWIPANVTVVALGLSLLAAAGAILRGNVRSPRNGIRPPRNGIILTVLFAAFVLYALVSLSWSPGGNYARGKALRLVVATSWALAGPALIIAAQRRRIHRFLGATTVIGLFTAAMTLLSSEGIVMNPSANYLIAGRVIGLEALAMLYYSLVRTWGTWRRFTAATAIAISVIALAVGGGRAPFVATLLAAIGLMSVLAVLRTRAVNTEHTTATDGGKTSLQIIAYASVGIIGTVVSTGVLLIIGWIPRTIARLITVSTVPGSSLGSRFGFWEASVSVINTRPLLGYGLGSWPIVTSGGVADYPHNIVLEVMVELGVVGLVLLLLVIGFGFVTALRTMRSGTHLTGWLLLTLAGFMLINAMISSDVNGNRYLFAYIGLLIAPTLGSKSA